MVTRPRADYHTNNTWPYDHGFTLVQVGAPTDKAASIACKRAGRQVEAAGAPPVRVKYEVTVKCSVGGSAHY